MGLPPALQAVVNTNLGSVFIGLVISAAIFGVTNVQVFLYFSKYSKRDPVYLKTVVGTLYCLDWLHLIFATHAVYFYTISNFANAAILSTQAWSLVVQVIVSAISDMIVQLCYCWRIWIMSKRSWLLTGVGILLSALCLAFSLTFSGIILGFSSLLQNTSAAWALYSASATAVAADAWIAAVLCFYLFRSKTGWKVTDTIATRLMIYIVNTGLLTTVVVTASLITFATMPSSYVYIGIYLSYSKRSLLQRPSRHAKRTRPPPQGRNERHRQLAAVRQFVFALPGKHWVQNGALAPGTEQRRRLQWHAYATRLDWPA